jgi:TonB family protein
VAAHAAAIFLLTLIPAGVVTQPEKPIPQQVTPLIAPSILTQTAPNTGKVAKQFHAESRPKPQLPTPPAPAAKTASVRTPVVKPPEPKKQQAAALPDAPIVPPEPKNAPKPDVPLLSAPAPPPQIQAEEKKVPFENANGPHDPGAGRLRAPDTSVSEAIKGAIRGGSSRPPLMGTPDGSGPAVAPSQGELPQLLSDPMGVDFRPYLTRILGIVRKNWFTIFPESARMGLRGNVSVLFAIAKNGGVTRANYAQQTGVRALDNAAISAISMSNPFPPLPLDFKGDRIVLQFNFAYNVPK